MEVVLSNTKGKYSEIYSFLDLDNIHENCEKFSSMKGTLEAKIFSINESISSYQLSKLKNHFDKINFSPIHIYSNNRDTVLSGKFLKIDSAITKEQEIKNKLLLFKSKKIDDILHKGTLRSGERISSNGNLCIIGDVNPGAIVYAKKNIYVWGKLLGNSFCGKKWK